MHLVCNLAQSAEIWKQTMEGGQLLSTKQGIWFSHLELFGMANRRNCHCQKWKGEKNMKQSAFSRPPCRLIWYALVPLSLIFAFCFFLNGAIADEEPSLQRRCGANRSKSAKWLGTCNYRQRRRNCTGLHVHAVSRFRSRCSNRGIGYSPISIYFQSMEPACPAEWFWYGVTHSLCERRTSRVVGFHWRMVAYACWWLHGIHSA